MISDSNQLRRLGFLKPGRVPAQGELPPGEVMNHDTGAHSAGDKAAANISLPPEPE